VVVKWRGEVVYTPTEAGLVGSLMKGITERVSGARPETIVDRCGILYLELLKVHPFREGNGRTARAFASYQLLQSGYGRRRGRSLENYIDRNIEQYYASLYLSSGREPSPWLSFFRRAVDASMLPPKPNRSVSRTLVEAAGRAKAKLEHVLQVSGIRA